jgi:plastocyanin
VFRSSSRSLVVLLSLLVLPLAACSSTGSGSASSSSSSSGGSSGGSSSAAATTSGASVSATATTAGAPQIVISNFAFSPDQLTVTPGQKVTVVNHDSTTHTLTATGNKAFDTGTIAGGATGSFTAPSAPGSYPYICTIHQFMKGTLTVK